MSDMSELQERRAALIQTLRGGEFRQGTGHLYREIMGARQRDFLPASSTRPGYYCCIGVGCALLGQQPKQLAEEETYSYVSFENEYEVSQKTARYLMAMNDGSYLDTLYQLYSTPYDKVQFIRHTSAQRDFSVIARFLEIIWSDSQN